MKIRIFEKILIIMLVMTVIPLGVFGYMAVNSARDMGLTATSNAMAMGDSAVQESTGALNALGEQIIKQKAIDVAKQLEIYIKDNPDKTVEDLQADEYFKALAVQPVGETGYTAITDVDTLICRFHASEKTVNMDLHALEEKLPGFWSVMSQSEGGVVSEGYYDWEEADGSIKQKYMYIAIVDAQTADGVTFSVAATTYMDEFSQPIVSTKEKIDSDIAESVSTINASTDAMMQQSVIMIALIIVFVVIVSLFFARSISDPIRKLKVAADKLTSGDTNVKLPSAGGSDEISELVSSMEMLSVAFKSKKKK